MKRGMSALLLLLPLAGCIGAMPVEGFAAAGPAMRPAQFFAGRTHGWGVVETRGGRPSRHFTVEGEGAMLPDGRFRLRQTVTWFEAGATTRRQEKREWLMTADGGNGYRATLTDAKGPVVGEVHGNVFHLRYRMASPDVMMEQFLYLQPDGRHVLNTATVTAMGLPMAHLSEIIVHE